MIDAGLPLVQCLDILAQQQENKNFQQVLTQMRQDVEEGSTLAAAMARHPKVFDQLFVNMIEAGETGGILDLILQRLSTYIEKIVKLRRDVISALIYPAAVIVIAVAVVAVIMIFVIPSVPEHLHGAARAGRAAPAPDAHRRRHQRVPRGLGRPRSSWAASSRVVVALTFYYRTPGGHRMIDMLLLKLPIIGGILRKIAVARFSRTLSTLLSSGVPILQSLEITARTAGNIDSRGGDHARCAPGSSAARSSSSR